MQSENYAAYARQVDRRSRNCRGSQEYVERANAARDSASLGVEGSLPGVWRATLGAPERYTPVSSRLVEPSSEAFEKLPRVEAAPLSSIAGRRIPRGFVVELPLRPNEQVFGFGLQFLSLAQRGKKKVARVNADPKMDTGDSHAPVPFYVTTEGVGILIDTARYANFYFGDARPKPTHPVESVAQTNPAPNYTTNIQNDNSGRITVDIQHAAGVDVYYLAGPHASGCPAIQPVFRRRRLAATMGLGLLVPHTDRFHPGEVR